MVIQNPWDSQDTWSWQGLARFIFVPHVFFLVMQLLCLTPHVSIRGLQRLCKGSVGVVFFVCLFS